jgi:hypothetical protein
VHPEGFWEELMARAQGQLFSVAFIDPRAGIRNVIEGIRNADFPKILVQPSLLNEHPGDRDYFHEHTDQSSLLRSSFLQGGEKPIVGWVHDLVSKVNQSFMRGDYFARWQAFKARVNLVRQAFAGFDPAKATPEDVSARMRRAGMDEHPEYLQRRFMEVLTAQGVEGAARWAGDQQSAIVHGRYERWERSPVEQGRAGRLYGSAMEYTRGKAAQFLTDLGKTMTLRKGFFDPSRLTAIGRLATAYLTYAFTDWVVDQLRGKREAQEIEDQESGTPSWTDVAADPSKLAQTVRFGNFAKAFFWSPGGVSQTIIGDIRALYDATTNVVEGEENSTPKLVQAARTMARTFVPFYKQFLGTLNTLGGQAQKTGYNVQVASWADRGIENALRALRGVPALEDPKAPQGVNRNSLWEQLQSSLFGTDTGLLKWDDAERARHAGRILSLSRELRDPALVQSKRESAERGLRELLTRFKNRGLLDGQAPLSQQLRTYLEAARQARDESPRGDYTPAEEEVDEMEDQDLADFRAGKPLGR